MADNGNDKKNNGQSDEKTATPPLPEDRTVSSRHTLKIRGRELKYTATVGTVVLKEEDDKEGHKPRAEMFFVAFTRDGVRNRARRSITFSFNGGPGSSSVWMLLGLLGPRRVPLSDHDSGRVEPPYQLRDNEHTLLEETDLVFVSAVLNFQTLLFNPGNDLPFVLYLPSYALAARYHGKLPKKYQDMNQDKLMDEVRKFAEEEYNQALMKGDRLNDRERDRIVKKLAEYTGLSQDYIEGSNLRVSIMRFAKELLRREGKAIGRFDSRITGVDKDDVGENFERDPSFDMVQGVYSACLNDYVRRELKFESDLPYEILSFKILPKWKYEDFQNSYVNTAETLRGAMMKNPHLRVFVANGLYDLATPFFATEYTFDHLGLRDGLQKNVAMGYYPAGHMMYSHKESLAALTRDLKQFIKQA